MKQSNKSFNINQRLEIAPVDSMEYFSSRIEDVRDGNLFIAMPMRNAVPVYLPKGEKILGRTMIEDGVMYSFESVLLDYSLSPIPVWLIQKPENVVQIQKRDFFRYDLTLPVKYLQLDDNSVPIDGTDSVTVSKNLSGGGLLMVSNKKSLPIGTKLWVEVPLNEMEVIRGRAQVLRTTIRELPDGGKVFLTGVQFLGMDEMTRKKIINFLNAKILERRSKGIL